MFINVKIAVLLAAYNGMRWIAEQVESILNQKGVEIHLFISVDLSVDGTQEWCEALCQKDSRVVVLEDSGRLGSAAKNFFRLIKDVDFSGFDFVALADQDDIWLEDKLVTACTKIRRNHVDAYSSNVMAFWENGSKLLIDKAQSQRRFDYLFEAAGPGCTYVLRTRPLLGFKESVISQWSLANQIVLHDWLIYAYFRANGYDWLIDPGYKMLYRQHHENLVGINEGWKAGIKRLRLLTSGWYKRQVRCIADFVGAKAFDFGSRLDVIKNISHLRRRLRDRIALFLMAALGLY
ncbi:MAG: glycosyltransferase [Gammaproteobacteria bacterium]